MPEALVHEAVPTRSPLKISDPEVIMKIAFTLAPGTIGSANFFEDSVEVKITDSHPLGTVTLRVRSFTGAAVVFVNLTVVFC